MYLSSNHAILWQGVKNLKLSIQRKDQNFPKVKILTNNLNSSIFKMDGGGGGTNSDLHKLQKEHLTLALSCGR